MKCKLMKCVSLWLILLMVFNLLPPVPLLADMLEGEVYSAEVETAAAEHEEDSKATSSENVELAEKILTDDINGIAFNLHADSADITKDAVTVSAFSRIEAPDTTISPKSAIAVEAFDLSDYGISGSFTSPTALHLLIGTLEAKGLNAKEVSVLNLSYGWVNSIYGSPDDSYSGYYWMYTVKGKDPGVSMAEYELKEGDDVLFYCAHWEYGYAARFDQEEAVVTVGEDLTLTLSGALFGKSLEPLAGAELLTSTRVGSSADTPTGVFTDKNGQAAISFDSSGTYIVSAVRKNDKNIDITRPYCLVTVTDGPNGSYTDEQLIVSDKKKLYLGELSALTKDITLPLTGESGYTTITWTSSDTAVISIDGQVTRPTPETGNATVILTATITKGNASEIKEFTATVLALEEAVPCTARNILNNAKKYYDVTCSKDLSSWWDVCAVKGAWGSLEGYTLPDYSSALTSGQPSDYAGRILGMLALGMDPRTDNGQDIVADLIAKQSANYPGGSFSSLINQNAWAVIALNAAGVDSEYGKEKVVQAILNAQVSDGGFGSSLTSTTSKLDYTGMTLIALAGSREIDGASSAIARAVDYLKSAQLTSGQLAGGWSSGSFGSNSNTVAIVISGLTAVGEDVTAEEWMIDGSGPVQALALFQHEDGGFTYTLDAVKSNRTASYQSIIALGDVDRGNSILLNPDHITPPDESGKPGQNPGITNDGGSAGTSNEAAAITVRLTVKGDSNMGTLINTVPVELAEGAAVFDALRQGLDESGIAFTYTGTGTAVYVTSINGLAEFDNGPESGWMYMVNGTSPAVSCGEQAVRQGDYILFYYTNALTAEQNTGLGVINGVTNGIITEAASLDIGDPVTSLEDMREHIDKIASVFQIRTELSKWETLDLLLYGGLPENILQEIKQSVKEADGHFRLVTDTALLALILQLAGEDITDVESVNLLERIYNHQDMGKQGVNGYIFSLMVMSNAAYIPVYAENDVRSAIEAVLSVQNANGGFPLTQGGAVNYDITCMALTALAAYRSTPAVEEAINKGFSHMASVQGSDGYFAYDEVKSSETLSQLIIALCANGISPDDQRFVKDGKTLMELLLDYQSDDGGFSNVLGGEVTGISTEQAFLAMQSYMNIFEEKKPVYHVGENALKPSLEPFTDESAISDWAIKSLIRANEIGLADIDDAGNINPKEKITRAEFVKALLNVMGAEPLEETRAVFDDVTETSAYVGWIEKAFALGLISGFGDGSFAPDAAISCQDMAVIVANAYGLTGGSSLIADIDEASDYASASLMALAEAGLLNHKDGERVSPRNNTTREAAFTLLIDILEAYELKVR